jgi:hypothetical protein
MAKICVSILEIRPRHPLSFLLCDLCLSIFSFRNLPYQTISFEKLEKIEINFHFVLFEVGNK